MRKIRSGNYMVRGTTRRSRKTFHEVFDESIDRDIINSRLSHHGFVTSTAGSRSPTPLSVTSKLIFELYCRIAPSQQTTTEELYRKLDCSL